ncbi:MAG: hypothetical protein FWG34_00805 [Oscillospiraceae bacterium]|nr:hypothetical protein [Oscillospiraceae bacterium]
MFKKIAALLFFSVLAFCFLCSCNSGESPKDADKKQNGDLTENLPETETNQAQNESDELPELDYEGHEFHIYSRINNTFYNYLVEEETGEILSDAVYKRARNVEARLNITLKETENSDANSPRALMLSGDDTYDMYNARCTHALTFWLEGLTVEIPKLPYIDLEKPYWNKTANESLSLNKRQYVAIGAANIGAYDFIFTLLFNKKLIADFGLESPYELIDTGKWTIGKMSEMMKAVGADLDGNGIYDINDRYGYASGMNVTLPAFWIGAGLFSISKDQNDVPYFSAGDQKFIDVFNKVFELTWESDLWYKKSSGDGNVPSSSVTLFTEDRALFIDTQIFDINRLRGMETDFGIIMYPKYDETQQNYHTRFGFYDTFIVSNSNTALERTSAVIEALNSESYKTVIPVYYDRCLKTRNSRDEESEAMLDIIFSNLTVDLGDTVWADKIRDGVFTAMFGANNPNIASKLESMANSVQKDIDQILAMN